jgi:hypothetical protein
MKSCGFVTGLICLILGALIGAGITYQQVKCQTSGVNIKFDSGGQSGTGVTITKTGKSE